jgi:hypothetical protein
VISTFWPTVHPTFLRIPAAIRTIQVTPEKKKKDAQKDIIRTQINKTQDNMTPPEPSYLATTNLEFPKET